MNNLGSCSKFEVLSKVQGLVQSLKFCGVTPWAVAFEESPCHPLASEGILLFLFGVPLGEPSITIKNRHLPKPIFSVEKSYIFLGTLNRRQKPSCAPGRVQGNRQSPSNTVIPGRGFFSQSCRSSTYGPGCHSGAPDNFCFWRMTEASFMQEHPPKKKQGPSTA